ncbi:MAG: hypothetical protein LBT44_02505 [Clostridiales bacterium]|jgi:tyrosyl-tRNA synthetase|nr:hypothetical protein [Clostridiales bacterium]
MDGSVPTTDLSGDLFSSGVNIIELLEKVSLIPSRAEGRRLVQQGGVKINGMKITHFDHMIQEMDFQDGILLIQKGKKVFHRVRIPGQN